MGYQDLNPSGKRRWFLKAAAGFAGAAIGAKVGLSARHVIENPATVAIGLGEKEVIVDGFLVFLREKCLDEARARARVEGITLAPNPDHRPFSSIIQEGIQQYRQEGGGTVTWNPSPDRWTDEQYFTRLKELGLEQKMAAFLSEEKREENWRRLQNGEEIDWEDLWTVSRELMKIMPPRDRLILDASVADFHGFLDGMVPLSGIAARAQKFLEHKNIAFDVESVYRAHQVRADGSVDRADPVLPDDIDGELRTFVCEDISAALQFVEERPTESGGLVSSSWLVTRGLHLNHGDLTKALFDFTIWSKYFARNDLNEGGYWGQLPDRHAELVSRFANVKDEFMLLGNFHAPHMKLDDASNKDNSQINQAGLQYHAGNIAVLEAILPRVMRKWLTIGQMLSYVRGAQGPIKAASDLEVVRSLKSLEQFTG